MILKSTNNPKQRSMMALVVFSAALKFLKYKVMKLFDDSGYNIEDSKIRWVITVPAIWKTSARNFMRRAAYEVMYT